MGYQLQRLNAQDKWVPVELKWVGPIETPEDALAMEVHFNSIERGKHIGPNAKRYRCVKLGWG